MDKIEKDMYVKIVGPVDDNLKLALNRAHWVPEKAYKIVGYAFKGDKVFVHINNRIVDIFCSKVETIEVDKGIDTI